MVKWISLREEEGVDERVEGKRVGKRPEKGPGSYRPSGVCLTVLT
jgi:hypothetical protein